MNKTIKLLGCTLTAFLLAACNGKQNGYTIQGTISDIVGLENGDSVFLARQEGPSQLVNIDSTTVKEGTFTFKGNQGKPELFSIIYQNEGKDHAYATVILENGNINVSLTPNLSLARGTRNNDVFSAYIENSRKNFVEIEKTIEQLEDKSISDEQRESLTQKIEGLEKNFITSSINAMNGNMDTFSGITILKNIYYYLKYEELETLVNQIPESMDEDPFVQSIKEQVGALKKTAEGKQFVDLALQDPKGKDIKLSDYCGKGKVVLIDFWASWCGPCRREMPNVVEAYKKYKNKGFEIVGISLDNNGEAWKKAIEDLHITWPQMSDLKGWESEAAKEYAINSIPHTILVDKDGTILARGLSSEELMKRLSTLLPDFVTHKIRIL